MHHIGSQVDDMEEAFQKIEAAQGQRINDRPSG
jgi:hypothetical protein